MIHVTVRLFATLRQNREKEMIMELPDGAAIKDIIEHLSINEKDAAILMVNGKGAKLDTILESNDTVAIFPPVGGG
jgi:molybdopterin converting factor small subunit